jgi:hypothetical protein
MSDCDAHWPPRVAAFFHAHPHWLPTIPSGVPLGWDPIVADALAHLEGLRVSTGAAMSLAQVKEKFGGLRMYVDISKEASSRLEVVEVQPAHVRLRSAAPPGSARAKVREITDMAERRVEACCIRCGAPATVRQHLYRLCDVHRNPHHEHD